MFGHKYVSGKPNAIMIKATMHRPEHRRSNRLKASLVSLSLWVLLSGETTNNLRPGVDDES